MRAVQRTLSLILLVGCGWIGQSAGAIERDELLEKMKRMRPQEMTILETRTIDGGTYTLGIFSISLDATDPDLRRYKLWQEFANDLVVPTESVNCSTEGPLRVTRDAEAIYVRRLNPGGLVTTANREDHLVWWAACQPDQAGIDPSTLTDTARGLGYSTLLVESIETLRLP